MHEEAMLRDLRRKLVELAQANGATQLTRVTLWIGALSHSSEATVRERWTELVRGTPAEGAALQVVQSEDTSDRRAQSIVLMEVAI